MLKLFGPNDRTVPGEAEIVVMMSLKSVFDATEFMHWCDTTSMHVHMSYGTKHSLTGDRSPYETTQTILLDQKIDLMQFKLRWNGSEGFSIIYITDYT